MKFNCPPKESAAFKVWSPIIRLHIGNTFFEFFILIFKWDEILEVNIVMLFIGINVRCFHWSFHQEFRNFFIFAGWWLHLQSTRLLIWVILLAYLHRWFTAFQSKSLDWPTFKWGVFIHFISPSSKNLWVSVEEMVLFDMCFRGIKTLLNMFWLLILVWLIISRIMNRRFMCCLELIRWLSSAWCIFFSTFKSIDFKQFEFLIYRESSHTRD